MGQQLLCFMFLLEYTCATMSCYFLLHSNAHQLCVHVHPLPLDLLSHPSPPGHHRAMSGAPCAMQQLPASHLFNTWWCVHVPASLSTCPALSFPPTVSTSSFSTSASLQVGASAPFFYFPYIRVNIQYLFSAFWFTSLCMTNSRFVHVTTDDPILFLFMTE